MAKSAKISDKHLLYAKVFLDFANAKSSDEAGLKFKENVDIAFDVTKRYKQGRPPIPMEKFRTIADFENRVNQLPKDMTIIVDRIKTEVSLKYCLSMPGSINSLISGSEIDTRHDRINLSYLFDIPEIHVALNKLVEEDQRAIKSMTSQYLSLIIEHNHILDVKRNLSLCLNSLIDYRDCRKRDARFFTVFGDFFQDTYNTIKLDIEYANLNDDGYFIIDMAPIISVRFLHDNPQPLYIAEYYYEPIAYCLIEFLREVANQKYLKRCKYCGDFFLAEDPRRQFCYEPRTCKKQYSNKDVARRMKEDYRNPDSPKFKPDYLR